MLGGWSGAHASVADGLCGAASAAAGQPVTSEALIATADAVEEEVARTRSGTAVPLDVARLEMRSASASQPTPLARARYCAAAGELMRLSPQGSQYQAQNYLVTAFRSAREAGASDVAARAAYRLGLVSLAGPGATGVRGGGRVKRRGSAEIVEATQAAQVPGEDRCGGLADPALLGSANSYVSTLALECASGLALETQDPQLSALASLRLARIGLALADADPAQGEALRANARHKAIGAIPVAMRIASAPDRVELLSRLATTAIDLGGSGDPAVAAAVRAIRSVSPGAAAAAAIEARVALARGDGAAARPLLRAAILAEAQRPLPASLPEYYLLLSQADPANRQAHVLAAYNALEAVRPLLPRTDPVTEESAFSLYMRRVFESAADVQLAASGAATGEAPAIRRAQQIVETFRQAELQSIFGSECVPPRDPVKPEDLRAGETLLYPILLPDRVELLYVTGGQDGTPGYRRLPPNFAADRKTVARLSEQLVLAMSFGEEGDWRAPAARLYEILVKPIEDRLGGDSLLAIIPDGPLRAVPFAALLDGDGRFLVERTRLTVAPSLAYSQPGGGRGDEAPALVAASLQKELTLPAGYFSKLDGTAQEARIAAGSTPRSRLIPDFRKADLVTALGAGKVDILHLATHASFNGRSDRAFIVADGEVIPLSELRDLIGRTRTRGDELDLLVLSACETAVGDDEASMGLAGAAVQAGARSAIASLWQVSDAGTAELMKQFYGGYSAGRSKSEALRNAQLALIGKGGDLADPGIWAAFTLLGAWR
jgi:CHAT domain-containing protein